MSERVTTSDMTTAQKALGWITLGAVALALLNVWLFEALVTEQLGGGMPNFAERVVLEFPEYLPYLIAPCLVAQPFILFAWAFWSPRAQSEAECVAAATYLSQWLKLALTILVIYLGAIGAALASQRRLTSLFVLLLPLFGLTYTASMYRALQVQFFRVREGRSAVKGSYLALVGMIPTMIIILWPLGLAVPAWVASQVKADRLA